MNPLERNPLLLKRLLLTAPGEALIALPASPLFNSVKNDRPELLAAPAELLSITTPDRINRRLAT